jgi:hypothetical protein
MLHPLFAFDQFAMVESCVILDQRDEMSGR